MKATLAIIPGDGIGKEVVPQGVKALQAVAQRFRHDFDLRRLEMGYEHWKVTGDALPAATIETCRHSQGVLMGATGMAQWEHAVKNAPPGWGRRQLSRELDYCASVRPAHIFPPLANVSAVKPERLQGADFVIIREMVWLNKKHPKTARRTERGRYAADRLHFYEDEILPILKFSFLLAAARRKRLVLVAQTSIFQTSKLWLQLFTEMSHQFPEISIDTMAPDNAAMQLVRNPSEFDVIVCDSTPMGGMLNNLAGVLMGSIGMAPGGTVGLKEGKTFNEMVIPNG
ncbi:MAG: isocitrate/isopropylmalate family dehydrogenase, partial [Chloroflexota bacterium]